MSDSLLLKDAAVGQLVIVQHKIGDGEVREIVYRREPDAPTQHPYNVPVIRLRTMQGHAGPLPRYDSGPIAVRDPGEADGRTVVLERWSSLWYYLVMAASRAQQETA